jgi:hypothetical protein
MESGAHTLVVRVHNVVLILSVGDDVDLMVPYMQRLVDRVNGQLG